MPPVARLPVVVLALVVAVLAGACGADQRLEAEEYRAEAARICDRSQREAERIEEPTRATPESIADFFRRQLAVSERNVERFRDLRPPERLQPAHDRTIRATDEVAREVRRVIAELERGRDPRDVLTARRSAIERLTRAQQAAARELGVPECAD